MIPRVLRWTAVAGTMVALLASVSACVPVPADMPEERYTATLVDSVAWTPKTGSDSRTLRRVEVRGDSSVDTIPGVLTDVPAAVVPRTGIVGLAWDTAAGAVRKGFRYEPGNRRVHDVSLAQDMTGADAAPAISPDGQHVAYVSARNGTSRAVVRVWPRGRIVASGPEVVDRGGERLLSHAEWSSTDSFRVDVELPRAEGRERFLRVRGTVFGGVFATDTVVAAPPDSAS